MSPSLVSRGYSRNDRSWWPAVATITIEHFATREEVGRAEQIAIAEERPRFNRDHRRRLELTVIQVQRRGDAAPDPPREENR